MVWERYKSKTTSFEVESWLGSIFKIRSYCDDAVLGTTYASKPPVCKLKLIPTSQFANTNIAWDISNSISATGTIDTFDIVWGASTDIGDLSSQDWSSDPLTGNVQYTIPGIFTVTASVTDTLGKKSKEQKLTVQIIDDGGTHFINLNRAYISTIDGGVYTLQPGSTPVASNTGLTGNHINIRSMRLHPIYKKLSIDMQHIWCATEDGIAYSVNGASSWTLITEDTLGIPTNTAGDSPAPNATDPDNIDIAFDPQDTNRVYLLRTTVTRSWLYVTSDYGVSWSNTQVSI